MWSLRGRVWPQGRPREYILRYLASKPKSLTSMPTSPRNCLFLGPKTALLFDLLKSKITQEKTT